MNTNNWSIIQQILEQVLEAEPSQRERILLAYADQPTDVLDEVRAYLAHEAAGDALFGKPLMQGSAAQGTSVAIGSRIGSYRIHSELGNGGMGKVYLANRADDSYQSQVAIKILKRGMDSEEIVKRFRNERQILAALNHPNIAKLLDGGSTPAGDPFFVMEYVQGLPLDVHIQTLPTIAQKLRMLIKICYAVHYAHQHSVIHRDLKPSNILINQQGEPKLLDFGIAKMLNPQTFALSAAQTATHVQLLTPKFASPEQLCKQPVTTATDIYNLGLLFYEGLTGAHPYWREGQNQADFQTAVCRANLEAPSSCLKKRLAQSNQKPLAPQRIDPDLDRIVMKAMHLEPTRRYESAFALASDLERFLNGRPIAARSDSTWYVLSKFVKRKQQTLLTLSLIIVLVTAFSFAIRNQKKDAAQERQVAQEANQKGQELLDFTLNILTGLDPMEDGEDATTVTDVANLTAEQLEADVLGDWQNKAAVSEKLARVYLNSGVFDEAYRLAEQAFLLRIKNQDADHMDQAHALLLMGEITAAKVSARRAEHYFEEALGIAEANYGKNHPQVAPFLSGLASAYVEWKPSRAMALSEKALELYAKEKKPNMKVLAGLLKKNGDILNKVGRFKGAEHALTKALSIHEQHFPGTSAHAMTSLSLGMLYGEMEKEKSAEYYFDQALTIMKKKLGAQHIATGNVLERIGAYYLGQFRLEEAEQAFSNANEIMMRSDTSNFVKKARTNSYLGSTYMTWGKYVQAEAYNLTSIHLIEFYESPTSPSLVRLFNSLTLAALEMNALDLAAHYSDLAYESRKNLFGFNNRIGFSVLDLRCRVLLAQGKLAQAGLLGEQLLGEARLFYRKHSLHLAYLLNTQARIAWAQGNLQQAEAWLVEAITIMETRGEWENQTLAALDETMAQFLFSQDRKKEARFHITRAFSIRACHLGAESQKTWKAHRLYHQVHKDLVQ